MALVEILSPSMNVTLLALARAELADGYIFSHGIICEKPYESYI